MSVTLNKIAGFGVLFVLIFLSGFWLSRSGKPYGVLLFNLHKLIALATGVYLVVTIYRSQQVTPLTPLQLALSAAAVLTFLILIIAGGMLSAHAGGGLRRISPDLLAAITLSHHLLPYLAALVAGAALVLLLQGSGASLTR